MSVSVGFISLGCAKNLVDSQIMAGYLKSGRVRLAKSPETADILLVNTCAFIDSAREEATETILSACAHKAAGGCKKVIVTGCMVQRYKDRMAEAFPDVDGFLGIDELDRIVTLVEAVRESAESLIIVSDDAPAALFDPLFPTLLFSGGPFAYLKIAEGCDHRCAYCAIPEIRGHFRSRDEDAVFEEAFCMVQAGVRELNVISQDTLGYGVDRKRKFGIEALLRRIDSIEGDFWIRLLYGYPSGVTVELLELLCESAHIVRYLDLPVQHSHPDILRAMNRGRAVKATQDLAERLRTIVPGLVLRTTCLVGFPGETERHFEHLVEYVRRSRFDHLGVFAFSPEEGTPAWAMANRPGSDVAQERREILMQIQQEIVRERNRERVGVRDRVLLLRRERKLWKGRVAGQAPEVDGETSVSGVPPSAAAGDFIDVRITGAGDYDLKAGYVTGGGA